MKYAMNNVPDPTMWKRFWSTSATAGETVQGQQPFQPPPHRSNSHASLTIEHDIRNKPLKLQRPKLLPTAAHLRKTGAQ